MLHVMLLQFRRVVAAPHIQDVNGINVTHVHLRHEKSCNTLPETNSSPLKIDPWKFGDSYWKPPFLGAMLVFRGVLFIESWLLDTDPYFMVYEIIPHIT